MAAIQTNLTCDLQNAVKVQYLDGVLFSQDVQANQINVAVYDGGEPASISGTVTADIIRSDGGTVTATGGTIDENVASIVLPGAAYYVPGVVSIVVKLTTDGVTTSIAAVVANIYQSSTDTAIDPGTIIPSIQTLITSIETAVASIPADYSSLWAKLAPAFSSSASYAVGQYVTYDGGLYRFTKAHSGSWASGDVSAVSIGGELFDLKSALANNTYPVNNAIGTLNEWISYGLQPGYINISENNPVDIANPVLTDTGKKSRHIVIPCQEGDMFAVNGYQANAVSNAVFTFLKSDYTYISHANYTIENFSTIIIAPENAAYFVYNTKTELNDPSYTGYYCMKKTAYKGIEEKAENDCTVDLSEYRKYKRYISPSTNQWTYDVKYESVLIPIRHGTVFIDFKANASSASSFVLLKKNNVQGAAYYATGESMVTVDANTSIRYAVPEDAKYLCIRTKVNNSNRTPQKVYFVSKADYHAENNEFSIEGIKGYLGVMNPAFEIGGLGNDGSETVNSARARTDFIDLTGATIVRCINNNINYRVALYESNHDFVKYLNAFKSGAYIVNSGVIRILAKKTDESNITNVNEITSAFYLVNQAADDSWGLLNGKTVAIIGDSISTNGNSGTDSNVPEILIHEEDVGIELKAYLTYDDTHEKQGRSWVEKTLTIGGVTFTAEQVGQEITFTPAEEDIGKCVGLPHNYNANSLNTWWEVAKHELGFNAIPVCWSGSSMTSHEDTSDPMRTCGYAWHESQIRKCGIRTPGETGFDSETGKINRTEPDLIIIYRGTNDMTHSHIEGTPFQADVFLTDGYFDNYNWQYPANDSVTGGYGFKEAYCLTIKKLRDAYPNAKIFLCTLNVFKRINKSHFPTNNGVNSLPQYNNAIREIADFMGCGVIEFDKDGITFENCYTQGYITDDANIPTHPTNTGHKVMGLKAIADLKAKYSSMS